MSNSFCRYLTNGLRVQSWHGQLAASPCCYIPQISFKDLEFNEKFSQFYKTTNCNGCLNYVNGNTKNPSYPPNRAERLIPDADHTHPVYVELSIDNKCNAACLSCDDSFSTLWAEQNKKFKIKLSSDYPDPQDDIKVVDDLFNQFDFSYLTDLNFLGGEPLISKSNLLVMERLVNLGISNNIRLLFTTNGSTHLTDHQANLLAQFKSVDFIYSIDGIGNRFHYLRYPLKWKKLLSVIESTRKKEKIKLSFTINMTVNPLNAFYIDEVENWAKEYFKDDDRFKSFITPACNGVMSLATLPSSARRQLSIKHYDNVNILELLRGGNNNGDIDGFLNHLSLWDQNRKLNWKETFPDAVPFFENYLT